MATVTSVLVLNDKMSKSLDNIDKACQKMLLTMENTDKGVKKVDNSMSKASKSSGSFLKSMLGFSAISKVFGMITGQLGRAIKRFDTLNNYTNIMGNLGVDKASAEMSKKMLSEGLRGLPTALDDAVLSVQRFTSANGNIKASTKMFLALNNALLAGRCIC